MYIIANVNGNTEKSDHVFNTSTSYDIRTVIFSIN